MSKARSGHKQGMDLTQSGHNAGSGVNEGSGVIIYRRGEVLGK